MSHSTKIEILKKDSDIFIKAAADSLGITVVKEDSGITYDIFNISHKSETNFFRFAMRFERYKSNKKYRKKITNTCNIKDFEHIIKSLSLRKRQIDIAKELDISISALENRIKRIKQNYKVKTTHELLEILSFS